MPRAKPKSKKPPKTPQGRLPEPTVAQRQDAWPFLHTHSLADQARFCTKRLHELRFDPEVVDTYVQEWPFDRIILGMWLGHLGSEQMGNAAMFKMNLKEYSDKALQAKINEFYRWMEWSGKWEMRMTMIANWLFWPFAVLIFLVGSTLFAALPNPEKWDRLTTFVDETWANWMWAPLAMFVMLIIFFMPFGWRDLRREKRLKESGMKYKPTYMKRD